MLGTLDARDTNQNASPKHVAIIMDGNGRWATQKGMPRGFGHQEGAKRVREIVETAASQNIEVLTLYAFSHENWGRPSHEIEMLFNLLTEYLRSELDNLDRQNIKLTTIGERHRLPRSCQKMLEIAEARTGRNGGMRLVLALSYGGRNDLVQCCKNIARQVASGALSWQDIDETLMSANLATCDLPPPDLLIRTSGEERISNFLLWELAYSEFVFCKTKWPEFTKVHFIDALNQYATRQRRFGGVGPVVGLGTTDLPEGESKC